jgi:hypothetical protein
MIDFLNDEVTTTTNVESKATVTEEVQDISFASDIEIDKTEVKKEDEEMSNFDFSFDL